MSDHFVPAGMRHADFRIGTEFSSATGRWRCTDVGTRVIVAIKLDRDDAAWLLGPPYAVPEQVFDENDLGGLSPVDGSSAEGQP